MVETRSGFGNDNVNQLPIIERAPEVADAPDPITMVGVKELIQMFLDP